MTARKIITYFRNEAALRKPSTAAAHIAPETLQLIQDLKDSLRDGIGLAAPQINIHKRVYPYLKQRSP